jgi:hypothetical protein
MDVSISNDTIYTTEVDTMEIPANCLCYFDLCASVTGLQNGYYNVEIYRKLLLLYPDTLFYIGSISFTYGGSLISFNSKSFQSECYNITSTKEKELIPAVFNLEQNYPNPFNPYTVINYQLPVGGDVTLRVYDILGNEVATLVDEYKPAGEYEVEFNTRSYSGNPLVNGQNLTSGVFVKSGHTSGVYFYQLKAGEFISTKKMLLLK